MNKIVAAAGILFAISLVAYAQVPNYIAVQDESVVYSSQPTGGLKCVGDDVECTVASNKVVLTVGDMSARVWGVVQDACDAGVLSDGGTLNQCQVLDGRGITDAGYDSDGNWTISFAARANSNYATFVTPHSEAFCHAHTPTTTSVKVSCVDKDGTDTGTNFNFLLLDSR